MSHRHLAWVRHAMAEPERAIPADAWPLTPEAREAAARLARSLAGLTPPLAVVSSDERKAIETAGQVTGALGLGPAEVCPGLREVERPWTAGDYREHARGYLRSGSAPGWEPRDEVLQRLSGALVAHWHPTGATIAVGHGLAMSLWAAATLDAVDAVEFWDGLTFPDAWLFTEGGDALRRIAQ